MKLLNAHKNYINIYRFLVKKVGKDEAIKRIPLIFVEDLRKLVNHENFVAPIDRMSEIWDMFAMSVHEDKLKPGDFHLYVELYIPSLMFAYRTYKYAMGIINQKEMEEAKQHE